MWFKNFYRIWMFHVKQFSFYKYYMNFWLFIFWCLIKFSALCPISIRNCCRSYGYSRDRIYLLFVWEKAEMWHRYQWLWQWQVSHLCECVITGMCTTGVVCGTEAGVGVLSGVVISQWGHSVSHHQPKHSASVSVSWYYSPLWNNNSPSLGAFDKPLTFSCLLC